MKSIALFAATAALFGSILSPADEIKPVPVENWLRYSAQATAQGDGFEFKADRGYSSIVIPFAPQLPAVGKTLSVSFKVKGTGEMKPETTGFRFGLTSSVPKEKKSEGYYFILGVDKPGVWLYRKNASPYGQLGGREPMVIQLRSANLAGSGVSAAKAVELKLSLERTAEKVFTVKLYVEDEMKFKFAAPALAGEIRPFDHFVIGIGNSTNNFIFSDFEIEME